MCTLAGEVGGLRRSFLAKMASAPALPFLSSGNGRSTPLCGAFKLAHQVVSEIHAADLDHTSSWPMVRISLPLTLFAGSRRRA